jgi:hypothetical protein
MNTKKKIFSVIPIGDEVRLAVHGEALNNEDLGLWAPTAGPFKGIHDLQDRLCAVGLPIEIATSGISSYRSYSVTNEQLEHLGFDI